MAGQGGDEAAEGQSHLGGRGVAQGEEGGAGGEGGGMEEVDTGLSLQELDPTFRPQAE